MYINSKFRNVRDIENSRTEITLQRVRLEKTLAYYEGMEAAFLLLNNKEMTLKNRVHLNEAKARLNDFLNHK